MLNSWDLGHIVDLVANNPPGCSAWPPSDSRQTAQPLLIPQIKLSSAAPATARAYSTLQTFADDCKTHNMADPLSIIAGIVGVAVASAQLANKVHDFTDKVKNAPSQMHDIASEMSHLSGIIKLLATVLEEGSGAYKPQNSGTFGIRTRVKWVLSSGKVAELLDRIEALKSSLSILLNTTQLAVACGAPRPSNQEIDRLAQVITAGVKEIRQCVIGLQTAKPALMFEPSKLPTTGLSHSPSPRAYPWLSMVPVASAANGTRYPRRADPTIDALEPSSSQFETASWLYSMTLAPAQDAAGDILIDEGYGDTKEGPGVILANGSRASKMSSVSHGRKAANMQVSRVPPPQQLYNLSIFAVAQKLIHSWTFLDPARVFSERQSTNREDHDEPAELDISDEDEDDDLSPPEPLRRRMTFQEYEEALESGNIHEESFPPEEDEWYKDGMEWRSAPRRAPSAPTTQTLPGAWSLEDDIEELRLRIAKERLARQNSREGNARSQADRHNDETIRREDNSRPKPGLNRPHPHYNPIDDIYEERAEQKLREAEARLEAVRGDEEAERRDDIPRRKLRLGYTKDRQEREDEEARIQRHGDALRYDWERARIREERAREIGRKETEEYGKKAQEEKEQMDTRFNRLKQLLITQQEARERGEHDKFASLEKLIRSQKDEQLLREAAAAAQAAEKESKNAEAREATEEKRKTTERLQQAKRRAREEAERKAAEELAAERELRIKAEELALAFQSPQPNQHTNNSIISDDLHLAISNLINMVYGQEPGIRWYQTAAGLQQVDISDGYFARKMLQEAQTGRTLSLEPYEVVGTGNQHTTNETQHERDFPDSESGTDFTSHSAKHHLVFSTSVNVDSPECNSVATILRNEGVETLFEIGGSLRKPDLKATPVYSSCNGSAEQGFNRSGSDIFVDGSLLWQKLPRHGRSELYESLYKVGWRPTYQRTSDKGQTWFHGERPVHVRFNQPDYVPHFADFENDTEHACVLIGEDIVDEDALRLTGIQYQPLQGGCWKLEATVAYDDIASLVATSFSLREMNLRRVARRAFSGTTTSLRLGKESCDTYAPVIPALQAFSYDSEPSIGAKEE
ncbi:hypothetical protein OPT61_g6761 [Boeremia exigua]|uniref:Uncharacterized protein n=1 Tax=Boeremia exigua TaxID=749465 RepID=A0ACC2I4T8_9PLEO|nr:hypothetical protein OPT61_g6761 [Boeremia exigua]